MQITIDTEDLLNILIDAQIDEVNAKALILDIIRIQERIKQKASASSAANSPIQKPKPAVEPARPAIRPTVVAKEPEPEIESDLEDFEEEIEDDTPRVTRVNNSGSVRRSLDFSAFGGDSVGLGKGSK